jgi:hypothetical protein
MPWSKLYWVSAILFFFTGCSKSTYDIGTSQSILGLWHGISSSPINGLHAAYGIGGVLASQIMQPFIQIDPFDATDFNDTLNQTAYLTPNDIHLQIPFGLGGIFGILVSFGFLISQYCELKQFHVHTKSTQYSNDDDDDEESELEKVSDSKKTDETESSSLKFTYTTDRIRFEKFQRILFKNVLYKNRAIYIIIVQVILINLLFLNIYSFFTTLGYMRTYVTKGPAHLAVDDFMEIQTTFWICFIVGRI